MKLIWRAAALAAGLLTALGLALPASAATAPPPLPVSLSASGTGASAAWQGNSIVLTVGSPSNTTYAQMAVKLPTGALAPAQEPTFTTSSFSTGSPRWVIEFANGDGMMNNQASGTVAGKPGDAMWQVNTGGGWSNTLYTYAKALAVVDSNGQVVVKQAFIVADGDQAAGTADTLSAVQYNGQSPVAPPSIVITASAKCGTWKGSGWSIWYHPAKGAPARTVTVWNVVRGTLSKWDTSVRRTEGQYGRIHARNGAITIGYWAGKYHKHTYVLPGHLPAC